MVLFCFSLFSSSVLAASLLGAASTGNIALLTQTDADTVSVYEYNSTALIPSTQLSAPQKGRRFGEVSTISQDGSTIVITAYEATYQAVNYAGLAYVYIKSGGTWIQQSVLNAPSAAEGDQFGISAALSSDGNILLIGANRSDPAAKNEAGNVFVFTRSGSTWTLQTTLIPSDALAGDSFGVALAVLSDASIAVIGASGADDNSKPGSGKAYVFTRSGSTWTQQQILNPSNPNSHDAFGTTIAMSGTGSSIIIGAPGVDGGGKFDVGAAYIFTKPASSWTQHTQFSFTALPAMSNYGIVQLSSDGLTALVGSLTHYSSTAYTFTFDGSTWSNATLYTNPFVYADSYLGNAVSGGRSWFIRDKTIDENGGVSACVIDSGQIESCVIQ